MLKSNNLKITAILMHKYNEKSSHTWYKKMNSMGKGSEQARVMTTQWIDIIQDSNNKHKTCLLKEHKDRKQEGMHLGMHFSLEIP